MRECDKKRIKYRRRKCNFTLWVDVTVAVVVVVKALQRIYASPDSSTKYVVAYSTEQHYSRRQVVCQS